MRTATLNSSVNCQLQPWSQADLWLRATQTKILSAPSGAGTIPVSTLNFANCWIRSTSPLKTVRRADHLFHISKYPAFQVGIPFSLFERAETVVKEAYGSDAEPQDAAQLLPYEKQRVTASRTISPWLPASRGFAWSSRDRAEETTPQPESTSEQPSADSFVQEPCSDWDPDGWHPEDATAEVWSEGSPEFSDMLGSSLKENQIHFRFTQSGGKRRLFVLREDESRAREIVREVVEGVPPK